MNTHRHEAEINFENHAKPLEDVQPNGDIIAAYAHPDPARRDAIAERLIARGFIITGHTAWQDGMGVMQHGFTAKLVKQEGK